MSNGNRVRPPYADYAKFLRRRNAIDRIAQRHAQADDMFRRLGITFAVYGQEEQDERLIPFDVVPRIIAKQEWDLISKGCCQRVTALNHFIADVYGKKEIFKAGEVPRALLKNNAEYCKEMEGFTPPGGIYTHISGVDLVRTDEDDFYVLEDNLRCPSGVSYMLENRDVMTRLFPDLFDQLPVAPVSHYPADLLAILRSTAPSRVIDPTVVVLTPGRFNSAYFEHAFLADEMGVELVEGKDLYVRKNHVFMRTIDGPQRVDVIYRRINDDFLDPKQFNKDSMLGVPGLFQAYRSGKVTIANAVGNGIADDKAVYDYVPEMIRYYLNEEPVLKNVPTFHLKKKSERDEVLDKITSMVIKEVHGTGGYGMLVGPKANKKERDEYVRKVMARPSNYIAQPALALSTCPTFDGKKLDPRHVDLRPYVLMGRDGPTVVPGGLTRVALKKGSLVVNSSQGGGTKDTWVLSK
jgi:uncharacterized circularly permuted ATP-grasp superfamily protein